MIAASLAGEPIHLPHQAAGVSDLPAQAAGGAVPPGQAAGVSDSPVQVKTRRSCFTLVEILMFAVLAIGLIGSAYVLFHQVWQYCEAATRQNVVLQEIATIRGQWRRFVHQCPAAEWSAGSSASLAGADSAQPAENAIILTHGGSKTTVALPRGMTGALSIEKQPGLAPCAVLTLAWETKFFGKTQQHQARLVACPPAKIQGSSPKL